MSTAQPGILAPLPAAARHLFFHLRPGVDPRPALARLGALCNGEEVVAGIGESLAIALRRGVPGLRTAPQISGPGVEVPSTPAALWLWLRGEEPGQLLHRSRALCAALEDAFALDSCLDTFVHDGGRDLTGYEDGTENPTGEAAEEAALARGLGEGLEGSSFVAVQKWLHDFAQFERMSGEQQDLSIGRRRSDNEEIEDAPASAHTRRTAQESFAPEAFVLRRSMPWVQGEQGGLLFVAFGHSFDAFEAQLRRMTGQEDGIVDALFRFTRPVTGAYFWCPPLRGESLDLSALGVG